MTAKIVVLPQCKPTVVPCFFGDQIARNQFVFVLDQVGLVAFRVYPLRMCWFSALMCLFE